VKNLSKRNVTPYGIRSNFFASFYPRGPPKTRGLTARFAPIAHLHISARPDTSKLNSDSSAPGLGSGRVPWVPCFRVVVVCGNMSSSCLRCVFAASSLSRRQLQFDSPGFNAPTACSAFDVTAAGPWPDDIRTPGRFQNRDEETARIQRRHASANLPRWGGNDAKTWHQFGGLESHATRPHTPRQPTGRRCRRRLTPSRIS
jgi:hypothetical protein